MAARYLLDYIGCYRHEYRRFTSDPPDGPGYPSLEVSPYLAGTLDCLLASDGAVVCLFGPDDIAWPPEAARAVVVRPRSAQGAMTIGGPDLAPEVADGVLPAPAEWGRGVDHDNGIDVRVARFDLALAELLPRLLVSDWRYKHNPQETYFWMPFIARRLRLRSVSGKERYFEYLEILDHVEPAAWDQRGAALRAHVDVRRDFIYAAANPEPAGSLSSAGWPEVRARFGDVLVRVEEAIEGFSELLDEHPDEVEESFHRYLLDHPVLLDPYAEAISKPRFEYPTPQAHTDKTYVEPDILLALPGGRYRLIELERPDHAVLLKAGGARAPTAHAAFQTAEWQHFIAHYPGVLGERFPGLVADRCAYTIVIGRRGDGEGFAAKQDVMARQLAVQEVLTYDDILDRARVMQAKLRELAFGLPSPGS
ncbi:MAG: hypothetical protein QOK43_1120 [Acidimicrobiaceae bacterium]|nr:hypothetical protein [Acidimicrobiaceae bacterium]